MRYFFLIFGCIFLGKDLCAQSQESTEAQEAYKALFAVLNNADLLAKKSTDFNAHFFKSSEIFIDKYPVKIPFLGGVILPNISDTGLVYSRLIEGYISARDKKTKEFIYKLSEFGKVQNYPVNSTTIYMVNPYKSFFQVPYVEANFYLLPFRWNTYRDYTFLYNEKIRNEQGTFYRFTFSPKNIYGSFFSGTVSIDSTHNQIAGLRLFLESKNKLNLADSLLIELTFSLYDGHYLPASQEYNYYYSVRGYTGRHIINLKVTPTSEIPILFSDPYIKIEIQDTTDFEPEKLTFEQFRLFQNDKLYIQKKISGDLQDSLLDYALQYPIKTFVFSGLKVPINKGKNILIINPLWQGLGFNAVESFYTRLGARIIRSDRSNLTYGVEFRPSLLMDRFRWQQSVTWDFLHAFNGKGEIMFGNNIFQINENEPVLPVINSFYSLILNENYASFYEKSFFKGVFSVSINSFDIRVLTEYSNRRSLTNNLERSPFWNTGNYVPNNPIRPPVINTDGFDAHRGFTVDLDLSWQPGRYHKIHEGRRIPLKSEKPMYFANYRKGLNVLGSEIDFDQITIGLQVKRRISRFGVSTLDVQYGRFFNQNNIQFIDFKHFNGIQTLFLQPTSDRWSDIRQFRTLRYYDYSTDDYFLELHYIHKFGGSLFNNFRFYSRLNIHTVAGLNMLSTQFEDIYFEPFIGFENLFKIFKMQLAYGMDNWQRSRLTLRIGFNFNIGLYQKFRRI